MNRCVVRNVVPIIAQRRWVKRQEPDGGDPKVLEIVESLREAGEIADAIRIAVAESAYMKLINNGIFVPEIIPLQSQRSALLSDLAKPSIGDPNIVLIVLAALGRYERKGSTDSA